MINYVPLHVHTDKSLMDGCATVDEYGDRALALGMTSMAITDHGTMSNHREFNRAMRERGIKPIFGIEAYVTPDIKDRRDRKSRKEPLDRIYNHLTILAKNEAGYKNLSKLSNIAWTDGYFHKPRMDFDMLNEYRDGLILSSACMGGLINSAIEIGDFATAKKNLGLLRDIAGDDFYVEVMPHNTEGINAALIEMSDAYGIKTIVTPDCHHAHKGQKVIQEIMLIANTHPDRLTVDQVQEQRDNLKAQGRLPDYSELDAADRKHLMMLDEIYGPDRRMTFNKFDIHLLSGQEMWDQMGDSAREDAFLNTFEVDEKVETFEMAKDVHLLPELAEDPDAELARLVDRGLKQLGVNNPTYRSRAKEELEIIRDKQFAPYFLVVADAINWAMSQGIRVGPGRGSGVGSLVNYAIGNTHVDPVAHGLLFSRFIDPSRPDWPDIDVDIEKSRREEVKAYVANKYVHVAGIATYQKFQDKGMIKDIARVFNVPLAEVNKVNKLIEFWDEFKDSPTVKKFRDEYKFIEIYGDQLRGRTRGTGVHASGMVTSIIPIAEVAPIETRAPANRDRVPVVAVDMEETADVGLIKLDFLGLKTLSILSDTVELIKQRTGKYIDLEDLDRADPNVYNMLSSGHTMGVFQCEQAPYTKLLVQMGVSSFDELAATNALVRPGAAKTIGKEYISRKQGKRKVVYVHKDVESFTSETYGLPIYQEQIMQLCTELAGMTMVEANAVRRITSKKKDASALEPYRLKFVAGAAEKIGVERAELLWEDILKWSGYGFNKSHAVAYSYISYWTAWLKYYYPLEFITSVLKNEEDKTARTQYLIEAKRLGLDVLLPHVNKSDVDFSIEGDSIRIGLSSIKYVSHLLAERYIAKRPFSSYKEILEFTVTKGSGVNTRALGAMNAVGALHFEDNPLVPSEVKGNLYEYLNLPELSVAIPAHWPAFMTTADDFDDVGAHVMMGTVTNIRRGKGWSLVSMMDKTGTVGFFDSENSLLEKGRSYLFLIGSNRVVEFVPIEEIDSSESGIIKWLNLTDDPCAQEEIFVMSFLPRVTKKGDRMGTLIGSTSERELVSMVVFPRQFPVAFAKMTPGTTHRVTCKEGNDGGLILERVE